MRWGKFFLQYSFIYFFMNIYFLNNLYNDLYSIQKKDEFAHKKLKAKARKKLLHKHDMPKQTLTTMSSFYNMLSMVLTYYLSLPNS